eukprot:765398-Hanusia_phi.AAC.1
MIIHAIIKSGAGAGPLRGRGLRTGGIVGNEFSHWLNKKWPGCVSATGTARPGPDSTVEPAGRRGPD